MEPCMGFHFSLSAADDIDDVAATIPDHIGEWLDQRAHWQHQAIANDLHWHIHRCFFMLGWVIIIRCAIVNGVGWQKAVVSLREGEPVIRLCAHRLDADLPPRIALQNIHGVFPRHSGNDRPRWCQRNAVLHDWLLIREFELDAVPNNRWCFIILALGIINLKTICSHIDQNLLFAWH